jgi:glycosyltransferase involved in cell wall biosynthesis
MAHALGNVLDAAARCEEPRLRFLFVGPGAEREKLVRRARDMGLRNVVFAPPQPKERMPSFWSLCDVALVHLRDTPLFKTVIPSKMFEAMGMGLPILMALPRGEATELLVRSGAGIWVQPEDPQALLEAVQLLQRNGELRARLAENSLRTAPEHSRESQALNYMRVLEGAVGLSRAVATRPIAASDETRATEETSRMRLTQG